MVGGEGQGTPIIRKYPKYMYIPASQNGPFVVHVPVGTFSEPFLYQLFVYVLSTVIVEEQEMLKCRS